MSPDDMADYHEHMAQWCLDEAQRFGGTAKAVAMSRFDEHNESVRYWREKARENG